MRRVSRVERFGAELQRQAFLDAEFAEESRVKIDRAGAAQGVEAHRPETGRRHRQKGRRVVIGISRADATQELYVRFHLIGALRVARRVERSAARRNRNRRALERAEQPAKLPTADKGVAEAIMRVKAFAFAEGQFP